MAPARELKRRGVVHKVLVIGDGPARDSFAEKVPEAIFAGHQAGTDLGRAIASADLLLQPSVTETFGNVLTEALSSGLAVAGFDYAAARQFIQHGHNGLAVPIDRPDMLTAAATRLATDAPLRTHLRTSARSAVEPQSWETVIGRFESDLADVVARSHAPALQTVVA